MKCYREVVSNIVIGAVLCVVFVGNANAALAICKGKVLAIMNRPGGVYINLEGTPGGFRLCSADVTAHSITPETCKDFKSVAYLAFTTGRDLMVYVNNALVGNVSAPYNCPLNMVPANFDADISYMQLDQ